MLWVAVVKGLKMRLLFVKLATKQFQLADNKTY